MAQEFAHSTHKISGGIGINEWLKQYINNSYLSNDVPIPFEVYNKEGNLVQIPIYKACFIMHNFKTKGTSIYGDILMKNNKVAYFIIEDIYRTWANSDSHKIYDNKIIKNIAIIPLGTPKNVINNVAYMNSARMYLSKGESNINMSNDNIAVMLWSIMSCIAFSIITSNTLKESESLLKLLNYISNIILEFNKNNSVISGITKQLQNTTITQDNGQHILSLAINNELINQKMLLNILHSTLKRTYKHCDCLFIKKEQQHPIFGLILTMILAPLFNKYINNIIEYDEFTKEYYRMFNEITANILIEKNKYELLEPQLTDMFNSDLKIIECIVNLIGLPYQTEGYTQLLDHAQRNKSASVQCVEDYWGIIPIIKPFVEINTTNIFANSKNHTPNSEASLDIITSDNILVKSSHTTEWAGITFKENNKYKLTNIINLGISDVATGNTLNNDFTANMRFTFGNIILPNDREGYSIAGIHFLNRKYINKKPIQINKDIIIELTDKELIISNPEEIIKIQRKFSNEPLLIGFKNIIFNIMLYEPIIEQLVKLQLAPAAALS